MSFYEPQDAYFYKGLLLALILVAEAVALLVLL